jgi:hypothetical protein
MPCRDGRPSIEIKNGGKLAVLLDRKVSPFRPRKSEIPKSRFVRSVSDFNADYRTPNRSETFSHSRIVRHGGNQVRRQDGRIAVLAARSSAFKQMHNPARVSCDRQKTRSFDRAVVGSGMQTGNRLRIARQPFQCFLIPTSRVKAS